MRYSRIFSGRRRKIEVVNSCPWAAEGGSGDTGVVRNIKETPGPKTTEEEQVIWLNLERDG